MLLAPPQIGGSNRELASHAPDRKAAICEIVSCLHGMDETAFDVAKDVLALIASHSKDTRKAVINGVEIDPHPDHYKADIASRALNEYLEKIANKNGIFDLAQDNGHRVLTVKLLLNLGVVVGRGGNDLYDSRGAQYELKTLNLDNKKPGITTSHHLKLSTIARYRAVGFIVAAYRRGQLVAIYVIHPEGLEKQFRAWEAKLERGVPDLNNPLISISAVRTSGALVYGTPLPRRNSESQSQPEGQTESLLPAEGLCSLEDAMEASLERSRSNDRIKLEKAAAKAGKAAAKEAALQCELPL